jgi:hypothetical protein
MKYLKLASLLLSGLFFLASPVSAFAASYSLEPATGTYNKGCTITVKANLDSQGSTVAGGDLILQYDQSKFTALASDIVGGTLFDETGDGAKFADPNTSPSSIGFSQAKKDFSGKGVFATFKFKVNDVAAPGASTIKIQFDSNNRAETRDSNIAESSTFSDILSSTVDATYTIGSGANCNAVASPTPTPKGTSRPVGGPIIGSSQSATPTATPITKLNETALTGPTLMLTIAGTILTIIGVAGLAML